jgi:hypothetical protein
LIARTIVYAVAAAKLVVVTVHVIVMKPAVPVAGVHAATEAVSAVAHVPEGPVAPPAVTVEE